MRHHMSQRDNFVYLTFALILLLLGMALAQQFFSSAVQHLMQSTTVITLLVAVWGVEKDKHILRRAAVFPVAIIVTAWTTYLVDSVGGDYLLLSLMLIFFISTAYKTARQVLFTGDVDGNKILGAICLYLLMGLIWALIYSLIEIFFPEAFNNLQHQTHWYLLLPEFVYFSFVTLTTLGFGDITPAIPLSRFFVYMQAVVGQFYIAILVASLVGSRMNARQHH
ncbi:potassium channel family protein [Thalassotalea agarivorans]|uniref:Ion channel n=2 Tax=Thalassotalea agarivorans TaxID=349064 RepID=A0A1H9YC66_THASX|nr:potassium channel family protein [Thalassotalea agarivorans]SES66496.1 Ion channel [Thalassotalea agarivorans]